MAVPFSNTKLRVPKGFRNLLEDFTRDVLRNQPDDIFIFGAKYFQQLISNRNGNESIKFLFDFELKNIIIISQQCGHMQGWS